MKTRMLEVGSALDREVELGALGATDPVALHDLGPLGPLQVVEGVRAARRRTAVMRKNHCSRSRLTTRSPERSQVPSASTCSLASTVWQPGHQFTGALAR